MCVAFLCGVIVFVCGGKHVCQHVCVIIQWQEEFSLLPPPWEIKAINAAQDVGSEVIPTHWGQSCLPEGPRHSSVPPTAGAQSALSEKTLRKWHISELVCLTGRFDDNFIEIARLF